MKKGEKKNFVRNLYLIASIVLAAVLIFTVGVVVARFTTGGTSPENVVEAGNFYFTSDLLKEGGAEIALNPGTATVSFELRNSADKLRFADVDVNYTVSAEGGATLDVTEGTLAKDAKSTETVTLSGLADGGMYTVTAVGFTGTAEKKGFTKTLTATFKVGTETVAAHKWLRADDDYVELTVWTEGDVTGECEITYPAGLIPDNTDPAMADWTTGPSSGTDGESFAVADSSHVYRFFVPDGRPLQADDFTVTVGGTPADEKDPAPTP